MTEKQEINSESYLPRTNIQEILWQNWRNETCHYASHSL